MLLPVIVSPPMRAIHARHQSAMGMYFSFLLTIVFIIHFLTGGISISAKTTQYPHVIMGMSSYQAKGCANHIISWARSMSRASFHRLNRTNPLINAASVGARKVKIPMDVAGLMYGTVHPKSKPATVPYIGPRSGAVRLESKTFENVIVTLTPGTGYIIKKLTESKRAVHTAIKAMFMLLSGLFSFILFKFCHQNMFIVCVVFYTVFVFLFFEYKIFSFFSRVGELHVLMFVGRKY